LEIEYIAFEQFRNSAAENIEWLTTAATNFFYFRLSGHIKRKASLTAA
jgi:hypothetical protein